MEETLDDDEDIYEISNDFPFTKMSLENPEPISNGIYFISLSLNNKPLYVQLPKCSLKNGIISNKKEKYCDLLYNLNEQKELIDWIEQMEISCKDMIDNKKKLWFQSELTRDDIDNMMSPFYRIYRSGINILIRAYIDVNKHNGKSKCLTYDENENEMDISSVDNSHDIIPLLHIEGIRFSSKIFELDIKLTQMMVMENIQKPICMIKKDLIKENDSSLGKELDKKTTVSFVDAVTMVGDNAKVNDNVKVNIVEKNVLSKANENEVAVDANENEVAVDTNENEVAVAKNENEVAVAKNENEVAVDENEVTDNDELIEEVSLDNLDTLNKSEILELKKPNQVYYKIYKAARRKAKKMRQKAVEAFLEAKQIKTKYMLQHLDDSDDSAENSDDDNYKNNLNNS
jgi:hypothetical protein